MPYTIELPDELFAKLQQHAVPLIDTPLTVIARALEALAQGDEEPSALQSGSVSRTFNPAAPPDLAHTKPTIATLAGKNQPDAMLYWNPLLLAVIREAALRGVATQDILDLITVNKAKGEKIGPGFNYVKEANLSVQGQDANNAWRQIYRLASSFGIPLEVVFRWQSNEKAAMPNMSGSFFIEGEKSSPGAGQ